MTLLAMLIILPGCAARLGGPRRPIASAEGPGIHFASVAASSGLTYRYPDQQKPITILGAIGGGCAFLDFDNDGREDILLVSQPRPVLYRNLGDGRFRDVTADAGLWGTKGWWCGCAVGDYDADGWLDVVLTGFKRLAVLHNEQGRRFRDVTREVGMDPAHGNRWGLSAGFMELDRTAPLSLVLDNYVFFGPKEQQLCELVPGVKSGCPVSRYPTEYPELWQWAGGRFRDLTASSGMRATHGRAMSLAFADLEGSGRMSFYIGNDGYAADLMQNLGGMRFRNIAIPSGVAAGPMGHPLAAMGADWGDYDCDGRMDLAIPAFSDEPYTVYHSLGRNLFEITSDDLGIAGATYLTLGFGTSWTDVDNDGWPDLVYASGHVYDNTVEIEPATSYRVPLMLFHNEPAEKGRQFVDIAPRIGGDLLKPLVGRGTAVGDIDNDGRMDLLVVDYEGPPLLLHNTSRTTDHWVTFDVHGSGTNRFAYGAQVSVRVGGRTLIGCVSPARSFCANSDPRVHFGLGPSAALESAVIRWPSGRALTLRNVAVDRIITVHEP